MNVLRKEILAMEKERDPIKFEIVKSIGTLNTYPTGWSKEFNIVKWNDRSEKYDIRDWAPGHERMSRGVTMREDEIRKLMELCADIFAADETDEVVHESENEECKTGQLTAPPQQTAVQSSEEVPF